MPDEHGGTPTVTLDAEVISHDMAARLTIALLSQMLYMKGQIPLPVAILGRVADFSKDKDVPRSVYPATKKRMEFLESYDDLTAHLKTTFVALSTALAFNVAKHPLIRATLPLDQKHGDPPEFSAHVRQRPAKVRVLLILGPSPTAAKARLLLELDGFQIERFGERQHSTHPHDLSEEDSRSCESTNSIEEPQDAPCTPFDARVDQLQAISPPKEFYTSFTSSPTPCCSSQNSVAPSPPSSESEYLSSSEESFSDEDSVESQENAQTREDNILAHVQRAEEAALRAGERLLSRTLLVNGERLGFSDEIAPTQIHILIHAPRRLAHPTWVPRQNLDSLLDRHVQRFLDAEMVPSKQGTRGKGGTGFLVGVQTVGVRVRCRSADLIEGSMFSEEIISREGEEDRSEGVQEDDMIWWSWDGKLVGFSD